MATLLAEYFEEVMDVTSQEGGRYYCIALTKHPLLSK